jgi:hypothetical protein
MLSDFVEIVGFLNSIGTKLYVNESCLVFLAAAGRTRIVVKAGAFAE